MPQTMLTAANFPVSTDLSDGQDLLAEPDPEPTYAGPIVAIDGFAGTGKSTLAKLLAKELGFSFLDTGAMYRAVALLSLTHGVSPEDGPALVSLTREANMGFNWESASPQVHIFGSNVEGLIRTQPVTARVKLIALTPEVRVELIRMQREIATMYAPLVTEGRDQGSAVFPSAAVKFFIDADLSKRAERRKRQVADLARTPIEEVKRELRERDESDMSERGGLRVPPIAERQFNDGESPEETVQKLLALVPREFRRR